MTTRVSADDLPAELVVAIDRGDAVEVERDGKVIARLTSTRTKLTDWDGFFAARRKDPPLDYDAFLRDIEQVRDELNSPADSRWPS